MTRRILLLLALLLLLAVDYLAADYYRPRGWTMNTWKEGKQ